MGVVVFLGNHNAIERSIVYTQDPAHRRTVAVEGEDGIIEVPDGVIKGPDGSEWWPARTDNDAHLHTRMSIPGKQRTEIRPPEDLTYAELVHDLTHPQGIWQAHSDDDRPAWVASTDPALAGLLGALFGCEVRDVEDGAP